MEFSNPAPGEPDDVMSSGRPPLRRWEVSEDEPRRGPLGLGLTVWAILGVVAVLIGGVMVVQWATRSEAPTRPDSSLSDFEMNLPQPQESATAVATSNSPEPSSTGSPTAGPKATPTVRPTARRTGTGSGTGTGAGAPTRKPNAPGPPPGTTEAQTPARPTTTTGDDSDPAPDPRPTEDADEDNVANPSVNLAASAPRQASSQVFGFSAGNAVDGNSNSYWEAYVGFPQTLTVDLGRVTPVGRVVLSLPTQGFWHRRTQTITVLGSADGSSFSPLKGSAAYQFQGSDSDNQASATFRPTPTRFVQLRFTGANGWPAAQLAELSVHSS